MRVSFSLTSNHVRPRCIIGRTWACDDLPPPLQDTSKYKSGANRTASSSPIKRHFNASTFTSLYFDCTFYPILKIHAPALCPRGGRDKQSPPLQGTSDANRTTASPLMKRHFNASTRTSLYFDLYVFFPFSRFTFPFNARGGDGTRSLLPCRVQVMLTGQHPTSSISFLMPLTLLFFHFQSASPHYHQG